MSAGFSARTALKQAEAARKAGDLATALTLYEQILARFPNHASAKKAHARLRRQMGTGQLTQADIDRVLQLMNAGRFEDALAALQRLLLVAPNEALLHNIAGIAHTNLGRNDKALAAYQKAARLKPDYVEAISNAGAALLLLNRPDEALSRFEKALALKPGHMDALLGQANALAALRRGDQALAAYDRALAVDPRNLKVLNAKAGLLMALQQNDAALPVLEQALAVAPDDAETNANMGFALAALGRVEAALAHLEKGLGDNRLRAEVLHCQGTLLVETGARAEAERRLREVVAMDPANGQAWYDLALLTDLAPDDPLVGRMEEARDAAPEGSETRMLIDFALGRMREKAGDILAAAAHYADANRAKRAMLDYATEDMAAELAEIRALFTPDWIAARRAVASDSELPVFVLGLNRSGTTLVEQIIDSHSRGAGAGELVEFERLWFDHRDGIRPLTDDGLRSFADGYLQKLAGLAPGTLRVVDKLPANHRWIGLIKAVFPRAKIIHMQRDLRDVALSNWKLHYSNLGNQWAYDMVEMADYFALYRDQMDHWRQMFGADILDLSYEALTAEAEAQARRLLDFLGLDWEPGVLEFHRRRRQVRTASTAQVRQKLYRSAVGGWRRWEEPLAPLFRRLDALGLVAPETG